MRGQIAIEILAVLVIGALAVGSAGFYLGSITGGSTGMIGISPLDRIESADSEAIVNLHSQYPFTVAVNRGAYVEVALPVKNYRAEQAVLQDSDGNIIQYTIRTEKRIAADGQQYNYKILKFDHGLMLRDSEKLYLLRMVPNLDTVAAKQALEAKILETVDSKKLALLEAELASVKAREIVRIEAFDAGTQALLASSESRIQIYNNGPVVHAKFNYNADTGKLEKIFVSDNIKLQAGESFTFQVVVNKLPEGWTAELDSAALLENENIRKITLSQSDIAAGERAGVLKATYVVTTERDAAFFNEISVLDSTNTIRAVHKIVDPRAALLLVGPADGIIHLDGTENLAAILGVAEDNVLYEDAFGRLNVLNLADGSKFALPSLVTEAALLVNPATQYQRGSTQLVYVNPIIRDVIVQTPYRNVFKATNVLSTVDTLPSGVVIRDIETNAHKGIISMLDNNGMVCSYYEGTDGVFGTIDDRSMNTQFDSSAKEIFLGYDPFTGYTMVAVLTEGGTIYKANLEKTPGIWLAAPVPGNSPSAIPSGLLIASEFSGSSNLEMDGNEVEGVLMAGTVGQILVADFNGIVVEEQLTSAAKGFGVLVSRTNSKVKFVAVADRYMEGFGWKEKVSAEEITGKLTILDFSRMRSNGQPYIFDAAMVAKGFEDPHIAELADGVRIFGITNEFGQPMVALRDFSF